MWKPSDPVEQARNWRVAFIVEVIEEIDDGSNKIIQLDVDTARICEHRSNFQGYRNSGVLTAVKKTLATRILEKIKKVSKDIFKPSYRPHPDSPSESGQITPPPDHILPPVLEPPPYDEIDEGNVLSQLLQHTHTGAFELVTALTQKSINTHFKLLWEIASRIHDESSTGTTIPMAESTELEFKACLAYFSFKNHVQDKVLFRARFLAPEVYLVCEEGSYSAVLCLHLSNGHLMPSGAGQGLQPGSDAHEFSNWHVAFEVNLEIIDSRKDTISSDILKRDSLKGAIDFKQLVLSLSSARLRPDNTELPGATEHQREALKYYIQECYFPVLERARHQVLYTMPQNIPGTRISHQTFSALRIEIVPFLSKPGGPFQEGLHGASCTRNSIVILGMTGDHSLPAASISRGMNWICSVGKDVPHGTVYLSRKSFLEGVLLKSLERINHETTIIPIFWGINNGRWIFDLVAWDSHKAKKNMDCNWREFGTRDDNKDLQFVWRNKEIWHYDNDFFDNDTYSFDCLTHNVLTIPTSRMGDCNIQLNGAVKIYLKYKGEGGSKDWSSETTVTWSVNISFASTTSGLQVQVHPEKVVPNFSRIQVSHGAPGHETQAQALKLLKEAFPTMVDLTTLASELKNVLEGTWAGVQVDAYELSLARPIFNRRGDLLLELIIRGFGVKDA